MKCYINLFDDVVREITDVEYDSINKIVTFRYVNYPQRLRMGGFAENIFVVSDKYDIEKEYTVI